MFTKIFQTYNEAYFGGKLKPIKIMLSRRKLRKGSGYLCTATNHKPFIVLDRRLVEGREYLKPLVRTFLHEMTHYYIDQVVDDKFDPKTGFT